MARRRRSRDWLPVQLMVIGVGLDGRRRTLYFAYVPVRRGRLSLAWQRILYRRLRGVFFLSLRSRVLHTGAAIGVGVALELVARELRVRL